jgi:hypothetical protein
LREVNDVGTNWVRHRGSEKWRPKRMSSVFKREKPSKTSDLAGPVAPSVVASHQQQPAKEEAANETVA